MGELLAFIAAFGFAAQNASIRRGQMENNQGGIINAHLIISLSLLIMLTIALIIAYFFGFNIITEISSLNLKAFFFIVLEALLGPLNGLFLIATATGQIGASRTSTLRTSNPLFTVFLAAIFLRESPGIFGVLAVLIIITGIIISSYHSSSEVIALMPKTKLSGNFIALAAGFSFSLAQIARGLAIQNGATPILITLLGYQITFLLLLIYYRYKYGSFNFTNINKVSIKHYFLAGVGALIGTYALAMSFTYIPVWQAVAIRNLQPLLSIILAFIFLRKSEIITRRLIVGTIIVIIGVWLTLV